MSNSDRKAKIQDSVGRIGKELSAIHRQYPRLGRRDYVKLRLNGGGVYYHKGTLVSAVEGSPELPTHFHSRQWSALSVKGLVGKYGEERIIAGLDEMVRTFHQAAKQQAAKRRASRQSQ